MKMNDSAIAVRNAVAVRLSSRERPTKSARYSGPKFSPAAASAICRLRRALRRARQHVGRDRHLALAAHAADRRRRVAAREAARCCRASRCRAAMRAPADRAMASCELRLLPRRAQVHFVLLAGLVERGHLIAGHQQAERLRGIGHRTPRSAAFGRSSTTDISGLPALSEVSTSTRPGIAQRLLAQRLAVFLELLRGRGPCDHELDPATAAARTAAVAPRSDARPWRKPAGSARGSRPSPRTDRGARPRSAAGGPACWRCSGCRPHRRPR